ncbi:MAG: hypothetical protein HFH49_08045 [Lachnospiraceae bacterium]|nr:hypothetical protein [Lachnospiraceae bacterium]
MKTYIQILIAVTLAALTFFLLGEDSGPFFLWWLMAFILGCSFMPITSVLFSGFQDKGWMFSKVIAIAVSGYVTWLLVTFKLLHFTSAACLLVTLACIAANLGIAALQQKKTSAFSAKEGHSAAGTQRGHVSPFFPVSAKNLIFGEELILFLAFLLWTYVVGFRPQAFGEEKFMDFGFMAAMMRSPALPATDLWYSQSPINYYYGGQYYAVFLTKLTGTQIAVTYNLMRTLIAAMAFALPFSLIRQVSSDYFCRSNREFMPEVQMSRFLPCCAGLLAGAAVSLAGNMHYVIYAKLLPLFQETDYWFPDSTRFIGHDPETLDQTIHEFPAYSFIQGDLHAHVVNIYFVLTVAGLLYAWMKSGNKEKKKALLQPPLLMCGLFLGIFQWSNAWDFAIYYVVICGVCLFGNLKWFQNWKQGIFISAGQWAELLLLSVLAALPFTLHFDSGMAQGVRLAQNHSALYQLCVLWAFPVLAVLFYLAVLVLEQKKCRPLQWLKDTDSADIFTAVLCLCAFGLILMPELVYLRDIYEKTAARSNTMFKLTYQAFILFGLSMGYIFIRFLADNSRRWVQAMGIIGTICLLMTSGYTPTAVRQWQGNIFHKDGYLGLDATAFLETSYPKDAPAIRWLQENVKGSPVVLEANGTSYSSYCRVSAMTGLPTVLGWYTHEHLWRNDTEDLNEKSRQIELIYTSRDKNQVRSLLEQYQVSYLFLGQMEREKYPALNETLLRSLGEAVYDDETVIIRLSQ